MPFTKARNSLLQFDSYERPAALALVLARAPTAADCLRVFLEWGCVCDAPWWNRSLIADFLRRACVETELVDVLGPDALFFYSDLPDSILIWRGCERGRERGLSWTTDRAIAEGFAIGRRTTNERPTLVRAEIPKKHIFAVFIERQESEVIVDPRRLRKVKTLGL